MEIENKVTSSLSAGNQIIKNLRVCVCCGCNEEENKFRPKGKRCIKCYSKKNNETLKEKGYYENYYLEHNPDRKRQSKKQLQEIDINLGKNL